MTERQKIYYHSFWMFLLLLPKDQKSSLKQIATSDLSSLKRALSFKASVVERQPGFPLRRQIVNLTGGQ